MEIDFNKLDEQIYRYTCKTENCERPTSDPNSFCIGCFAGLITGEVERTSDYRYIKKDKRES